MTVRFITQWNDDFFETFYKFRNEIHKDIVTSFPETIEDYKRFFSKDSVFIQDYDWVAFLVFEEGRVVAKAILSKKHESSVGNLGFIDWINRVDVARFLMNEVESFAHKMEIKSFKTPVDLNFFVKYRIRCEGGGEPYYGEPTYPYYYHSLFKSTGCTVIETWDSYRLKKMSGLIDFFKKRLTLSRKKNESPKGKRVKTHIRCVQLSNWNKELKIIHGLFIEAYKDMPEFESINFEQFKVIYKDFKYLINPLYSYIVELQGKPVGFSINFTDPLSILAPLKSKKLNAVQKALLLAKLRLNTSCLMIAHVGKIPGPDGQEIKGVQIQVSNRISAFAWYMRKVIVTFQNELSPARRSFNPDLQVPYAKYVLYGKDLK